MADHVWNCGFCGKEFKTEHGYEPTKFRSIEYETIFVCPKCTAWALSTCRIK